jgi:hypothetical protein
MTSFLLAASGDIFLAGGIIGLFLALAYIVSTSLKKKIDYTQSKSKGSKLEGQVKVTINKPYMPAERFRFYNALQRALPLEYIAFPNVGVDNIIKPAGNLIAYNAIAGKYLDYVIFKKEDMSPVATVDLMDQTLSITSTMKQDPVITKTLKAVNIPVLEFLVEDKYNEKEILARFLDSQDPYTLAMLKKGIESKTIKRDYYDDNK